MAIGETDADGDEFGVEIGLGWTGDAEMVDALGAAIGVLMGAKVWNVALGKAVRPGVS